MVAANVGTPPDIIARVIAGTLTDDDGWRIVVENRQGAMMTIAGAEVQRQPADGHTVYAFSMPISSARALLPAMPFDLEKDFTPVIKLSTSYNVLVVTPSLPVHSIGDLVALLKSKPDKLTFSSGGFGTPAHLVGEMFKIKEGVRAVHVPYARMPQAIGDLLNGTNQHMFITTLPVVGLVKTGKLRALAVTSSKRVPALPDVPTVAEQGFPELAAQDWVGLAVKSGTPPDVVRVLNAAVNKALRTAKVKEAFAKIGADTAGGSPQEFATLLHSEIGHWTKVVKESGIKLQP
jgi:tripartite-type tricarboxylate transporter receptor subunit TctC